MWETREIARKEVSVRPSKMSRTGWSGAEDVKLCGCAYLFVQLSAWMIRILILMMGILIRIIRILIRIIRISIRIIRISALHMCDTHV